MTGGVIPTQINYGGVLVENIKVEHVILENLTTSEEYVRQVLPHIKADYFESNSDKVLFTFIEAFFLKHNRLPTAKILSLMAKEYTKFQQEEYEETQETISNFSTEKEENIEWLTDRTEKFCKDRAVYLALVQAIQIADGADTTLDKGAIPDILQKALSVCFDKEVGHDYLGDFEHRWDFYHLKEKKIPFPLEIFNKITNGGVSAKTLNVWLMATNAGKSLFMCDWAAFCIRNGYKALYITLEMSEEKIGERIDCNLMDVTLDELKKLSKKDFSSRMTTMVDSVKGNLVIKEYPTSGGNVGHFQALLSELKMKKNFVPDIIFVDYLNICSSARMKMGGSVNSYQYIKSIAEELRGFAVINNVPIISATQTNKSAWANSDIEMGDTSESGGLPMTVDLLIGGMRTEELDAIGQIMWKHLKSRYNDTNYYKRFVTGIDLAHFKFYDLGEAAQNSLSERGRTDKDVPLFDKSKFGSKLVGDVSELNFD